MHISTSTHVFSLAEDHIYNLRKIGVSGDDSWLESRRGEAFDRHFQVKLKDNQIVLFFEEKNIGTVNINNRGQVRNIVEFVEYWNKTIGPTDLSTIRTTELIKDWPQLLMKKELSFKCFTYNCAGLLGDTSLKSETWTKLLGDVKTAASDDNVIVMSFQETDNLNRSVKANTSTLQSTIEMTRAYLHQTHTLVSSVQLLGLMTLVFISNPLAPHVSKVHTDTSSTGFLRMWGNKGAVLTRFNLFSDEIIGCGIEMSIVNCHLSAGEGIAQLGRRRWELREIGQAFSIAGLTGKLDEGKKPTDYERDPDETDSISSISSSENEDSMSGEDNLSPPSAVTKTRTNSSASTAQETIRETLGGHKRHDSGTSVSSDIDFSESDKKIPTVSVENPDNDYADPNSESISPDDQLNTRSSKYILFMGDLNYRILLSRNETQKKIKKQEWEGLLAYDSLSIERRQGSVFHGFEEAAINFAPTYKYDVGTTEFASRVPSYTDRVLFRSTCPTHIASYDALPDLKYSDHRPVVFRGSFEASNCIEPTKLGNTMSRALKIADDAENNARPKLDVSEQQITISGPPLSIQRHIILLHNLGLRSIKWAVTDAQAHAIAAEEHESAETKPSSSTTTLDSDVTASGPASSTSSLAKRSLPIIRDGGDLSQLFKLRQTPDSRPLVISDNLTISPGQGILSASHPSMKLQVAAKIGVESRDFIALVTDPKEKEPTLQKYVFIKITPTKSCLGKPLMDLPLDTTGIPVPIRKCVEYLDGLESLERLKNSMFLTTAEPTIFQAVLGWLDNDQSFDADVLKSANESGNDAGVYAVAQVLLAIFKYSPTQIMGPSLKKKNAQFTDQFKNLTNNVCDFINRLNPDEETLDILASMLYDHSDTKAGKNEKRTYLRSILIVAESRNKG